MDLTKGNIGKHVKHLAIPASIGFFFNTMYNVIDTFYAGRISTDGIAALSLSFPIFFIILALGSGISQGSTALISNSLGENKPRKSVTYFYQSISFAIIFSILLTFLGLIISPTLFRILGATDEYLVISLAYINVILCGTIFFIMQQIFNSGLVSQGDSKSFRNVLIIGFFMNLILNPLFMYGWKFISAMGIKGIALATIIIQFVGTIYLLSKVMKTKLWHGFDLNRFKPRLDIFIEISKQGFPASLNRMTVALGIFIITFYLSKFGQDAVAAYGVATRVEQIALTLNIGLNMAVLSIVGQNNGAKKYSRIKETLHETFKFGFILSIFGGILTFFFGNILMKIFTDSSSVIEIGTFYLKIASFIFFGYVVLFQTVSMMQGMKKPLFGLYVGLSRQIVFPMILFPLFSSVLGLGLTGIWIGIFSIVWIHAIISYVISFKLLNKKITKIENIKI